MIHQERWFDRTFTFDLPPARFPSILERLRGTPLRLEERVGGLSDAQRTARLNGTWSIQEQAGHLLDLEPLWLGRVEDALAGATELRPTDLANTATHQANHNAARIDEVLAAFQSRRAEFVSRLEALDASEVTRSALHPRLRQPMRVIDLAYFVAEHDDHHLARISELRTLTASTRL